MGFMKKSPSSNAHGSPKVRRFLVKSLISAAFLLCFCVTLSTLVAYNNRLARQEEQIALLREQAKFDIASAAKAKRTHLISKRDAVQDDGGEIQKDFEKISIFDRGTTYKRWGRKDCSGPNTKLIYSGLAAMTHYTHEGGGTNFLCLYLNITYNLGKYIAGNQGGSDIYGVEYRTGDAYKPLFKTGETIEGNSLHLHSVPCSLCMAMQKLNHVMIPGTGSCPNGWNMEYRGFIMASHHGHKHPSQFICVDEQPQVVPGTHGDQGAGLLYVVETQCASLLCEPFVAGRELQCVVCSI